MIYFGLSGAFSNKRHELPFILICELASEADRNTTMQNGFSGLFVQPLDAQAPHIISQTEEHLITLEKAGYSEMRKYNNSATK
jgi:hypothetical protein